MNLLSILFAAIGLGFLVLIHELGHYWTARRLGMTVEAFSIGFGKPIMQWKWHGVSWQVGWIPFGGYVRIAGMEVGRAAKSGMNLYEVQGGFFSKSPWARIQVAMAGPVANLILALILFTGVWALGGRMRPFSEVTHRVGWVDSQSELFRDGVRPGDWIDRCDGRDFVPSRDWLCASITGDHTVALSGYRIDDLNHRWEPVSVPVTPYWKDPGTPQKHRTMGIESPANYMIYPGGNSITGLEKGDRLLWLDGVLLYSARELSALLNDNRSVLTIEGRGGQELRRVPRVHVGDLWLTSAQRDELGDWRFSQGLTTRMPELWTIPYALAPDGTVTGRYTFIDNEEEQKAFTAPKYAVEAFLQPGDKIIAVDGTPVSNGAQILKEVQKRQIHVVVHRSEVEAKPTLKQADDKFMPDGLALMLPPIANSLGSPQPMTTSGTLHLVGPIEPMRLSQIIEASPQSTLAIEWNQRQRKAHELEDPGQRAEALATLKGMEQRYMLGINLADVAVRTNPSPYRLFIQTIGETYEVLWGALHGGIPARGFSGPLGIVEVLHTGWLLGIQEGLYWLGVISINLGLLNLLPLPVLDGGTVVMSLWEMVTRRRIKPRTMEQLIIPFVVLLIFFFLFVTYNDISRLLSG